MLCDAAEAWVGVATARVCGRERKETEGVEEMLEASTSSVSCREVTVDGSRYSYARRGLLEEIVAL